MQFSQFRRFILVVFCVSNTPLSYGSPEYPTSFFGATQSDGLDTINTACRLNGTKLNCQFAQTWVRHQVNPDDLQTQLKKEWDTATKGGIEKAIKNATADGKACSGETEREIDKFKQALSTISKMTNSKVDQKSAIRRLKSVIIYLENLNEKMLNLCTNKDAASLRELIGYFVKMQTETCEIWTNIWEEQFEYQYSGNKWLSHHGPHGECGVIRISSFQKNPSNHLFWVYETRKLITNREQTPLGISCAELDESITRYGINEENGFYMNCVHLDHAP